jgi:hypothetical protein
MLHSLLFYSVWVRLFVAKWHGLTLRSSGTAAKARQPLSYTLDVFMSIDLRNINGDEFFFSNIGWAFYLNLAEILYGWKKSGTQQPKEWSSSDGQWQGAYDWNAGQIVTTQDALAFSAALDKYLADPERKIKAKALAKDLGKAVGFEVSVDENDDEYVRSFIQFTNSGEFEVW